MLDKNILMLDKKQNILFLPIVVPVGNYLGFNSEQMCNECALCQYTVYLAKAICQSKAPRQRKKRNKSSA